MNAGEDLTEEELAVLEETAPELEAELDAMEAADPVLKAAGDRLRDLEAHLRGKPSRYATHERSLRRMRKARMKWRSP